MGNARALYEEGLQSAQQGDYAVARERFSCACQVEPRGEFLAALGNVLLLQGDTENALEHLKQACDREPGSSEHRSDLAAVLLAKGMVREALQLYEEAVEGDPQNPEHYYRLGCVHLYQRQDYALAVKAFRQAVAFFPTHPEYQRVLGLGLFHTGRHAEASEAFRAALNLGARGTMEYNLACALYGAEDYAGAADAAAQALELDEEEWNAPAVNLWARALFRSGQLPEAREALGLAVTLEPENPSLFAMLGDTLSRLEEPDAAARAFQKAALLDPASGEHAYHEGTAFLRAGDGPRARTALRRASKLRPEHAETYNNLALAELVTGDVEAAATSIQRALGLQPQRAEFLATRASIQENLV